MKKREFFQLIKEKLIVSCQALPEEALHGSDYMAKMALAAKMGGAVAIRANGANDIVEIKKLTGLPIIGLVKRDYEGSSVYITPTKKEIQELINVDCEVIALDATDRKRPNNETLEELILYIRENSNCLIMADVSTFEEGIRANELGIDMISTTLSSYTDYTKKRLTPDFPLIEKLSKESNIPVIAEGNIKTPEHAVRALEFGAFSVVVGAAITRPEVITRRFISSIQNVKI